mmetsp:Transcript_117105/g.203300  ORF Transcript_117105/g.203300 Transcript_117105/m.203300 type:complete len:743 (-) Transcript_117105:156-2384(-)
MLLLQLKNSNRPINYGEFRPRRERKSSRGSSALRLPGEVGRLTSHSPPRTASSSGARSATAAGSASPRAGSATPRTATTPRLHDGERTVSRGGRLERQQKVFSNRNSYNGTMLDGRMHGDGLYKWSDNSEYAGEFSEGFMWGQGEKRWPNGRKYQGEWRRDMMWGDGEMTWPSGETFTGQFRKGIFHGKGTRVWPNGDWYAGEFKNGEQEGEGTFESAAEGWVYNGRWLHGRMYGEGDVVWPNNIRYQGEWKDGIREGHGRLTWPDKSSYEGQFKRNCIEGRGWKGLPDGSWFEGHFHDGELEGHGTFHWPDGTEFEGLWHKSEVVGPGCHRFPDDTMITGVFEDRGASGEGTKRWANGCIYQGKLRQNQIHHYGNLRWPDGRSYVGHFQDEAMHGDGVLMWSDKDGKCIYRGRFERNKFHGEGTLEWSNKSRYTGEFRDGLYHGEGTFKWPDGINVYQGQWEHGEMCGRGVLTTTGEMAGQRRGDPMVYVGEFRQGNMAGNGHVTFVVPSGKHDQYKGEFRSSMFHGLGTYAWASGHSLSGLFEANVCSRIGRKVYPEGQVYFGELQADLEHGQGVLMESDQRLIGIWREGRCVEELFETFVPALELDAIEGDEFVKVFGGFRKSNKDAEEEQDACWLPDFDENDSPVEGKAIVLYLNGDMYVGHVKGGKKHGLGMYVYADLTAYKGLWETDIIDGFKHPMKEDSIKHPAQKLHKLNEENHRFVEALKQFAASSNRQPGNG